MVELLTGYPQWVAVENEMENNQETRYKIQTMTNQKTSTTKTPAFGDWNFVIEICLFLVSCFLFIPANVRADHPDFLLTDTFPHPFVGFGAQMNPYLYC